jgi:hypothetical protein
MSLDPYPGDAEILRRSRGQELLKAMSNPPKAPRSGPKNDYTSRRRPRAVEHEIQVAVMRWATQAEAAHPSLRWLHAIPNGGQRHIAVAAKLKAEGVKRGVPDLCLPVPRGTFHGLYLELKAPGGKATEEQHDWLTGLALMGYQTALAHTAELAIEQLTAYLSLPPNP